MKDKNVCEYCERAAKFNDVGLIHDEEYSIIGVCEYHLVKYGVS
jgi:hypothetical protein